MLLLRKGELLYCVFCFGFCIVLELERRFDIGFYGPLWF